MENRGGSLLVSAAAGSGKTKVLVERLFALYGAGALPMWTTSSSSPIPRRRRRSCAGKIAAELLAAAWPCTRRTATCAASCCRVYQADIKTVDAFCARLLRENVHLLPRRGAATR